MRQRRWRGGGDHDNKDVPLRVDMRSDPIVQLAATDPVRIPPLPPQLVRVDVYMYVCFHFSIPDGDVHLSIPHTPPLPPPGGGHRARVVRVVQRLRRPRVPGRLRLAPLQGLDGRLLLAAAQQGR